MERTCLPCTLKESGVVGITKGKVTMDEAQQKMAREYVQEGRE